MKRYLDAMNSCQKTFIPLAATALPSFSVPVKPLILHAHTQLFTMLFINGVGFINSCATPLIYLVNWRFRASYAYYLTLSCWRRERRAQLRATGSHRAAAEVIGLVPMNAYNSTAFPSHPVPSRALSGRSGTNFR